MKLNQKISRFSAFFVLAGYLTVLVLNAVHIHHVDLGKKEVSLKIINAKDNNHLIFNGSEIVCFIHFAYSAINIFSDFNDNPCLVSDANSEFFSNSDISSKPTKVNTNHYFLRAPPYTFFS